MLIEVLVPAGLVEFEYSREDISNVADGLICDACNGVLPWPWNIMHNRLTVVVETQWSYE